MKNLTPPTCAVLILMLLLPPAYGSISPTGIEFEKPSLLDIQGNTLETARTGQQVLLSVIAHHNHSFEAPYLIVTEVRDKNDITVYLALQNSYIGAQRDYKMATSWIPTETGVHKARVFAFASWGQLGLPLSPISESRFTIE